MVVEWVDKSDEVIEHTLKGKGHGEADSGTACEMLINKTKQ